MNLKKFIASILIMVLSIVAVLLYNNISDNKQSDHNQTSTSEETSTTQSTLSAVRNTTQSTTSQKTLTDNWLTYSNKYSKYDFTFKYPSEWILKENSAIHNSAGEFESISVSKDGYTFILLTPPSIGGGICQVDNPNNTNYPYVYLPVYEKIEGKYGKYILGKSNTSSALLACYSFNNDENYAMPVTQNKIYKGYIQIEGPDTSFDNSYIITMKEILLTLH